MKIFGILLIFVGFLILKYFPGMSDYQPEKMTLSGILVGAIIFLIGVILLVLG